MVADIASSIGILLTFLVFYFLPTLLAFHRQVPSAWSIAVLNLFLGWTLVGWVVALALAVRDVNRKAVA